MRLLKGKYFIINGKARKETRSKSLRFVASIWRIELDVLSHLSRFVPAVERSGDGRCGESIGGGIIRWFGLLAGVKEKGRALGREHRWDPAIVIAWSVGLRDPPSTMKRGVLTDVPGCDAHTGGQAHAARYDGSVIGRLLS